MNNNYLSLSQNIYNSYPIQFTPNLNYFYYLMPDKQIYVPNYNLYQICTLNYLQNPNLQQLINVNNNKNETPIYYNYYGNIVSPINTLELNGQIHYQINPQININQTTPVPPPQDTFFLNKKRSNSDLNEKENEKINVKYKTEEEMIQIKDVSKLSNTGDLENNETLKESNETNIIKEKNNEENINIKEEENKEIKNEEKEENEKENYLLTSLNEEKNNEENGKENYVITTSINDNEIFKEKSIIEKKRGKKKKRNYAELLQDTLLEHIGEPKKKIILTEYNQSEMTTKESLNKNDMRNKIKSKSCQLNNILIKPIDIDENQKNNQENKEKNKKNKIKNIRHHKKRQHKITIKNNNDILADLQKDKTREKAETNPKLTKVIFHGDNYEKTKSIIDFMKYNFDFSVEEQYKSKKLITDYDQQHIDMVQINHNVYDNYNDNIQNLENIEQKWSRKKFDGDNKELKKAINIIRDSFPGRKTDTNEEKCLNILKNNDYNIEEFLNSKHK